MISEPLTKLNIADLLLKVSVQADYSTDSQGTVSIKAVRVVHGPLSLDITALLTEDDYYDLFEQLEQWYLVDRNLKGGGYVRGL